MSQLLRREIPLWTGTIIIILMYLEYYINFDPIKTINAVIQEWTVILVTIATGVGIITLVMFTYNKYQRRAPYWYLDVWSIFLIFLVAGLGLIGTLGSHPYFLWVNKFVYTPINSAIYGMIMFDIIAAFYRSFRSRTLEAGVLLLSALIIMMGNAPITGGLWPGFLPISTWVNNIPNNAGATALFIVGGIGLTIFSIRIMLQKERTSVGVLN